MTYFVYLIVSNRPKNRLTSYVGYTKNLNDRINKHNSSKGAKFTRGKFWKLAYSKRYQSKNIALKEEYKLKKNYTLRKEIKNNYKKDENISSITL